MLLETYNIDCIRPGRLPTSRISTRGLPSSGIPYIPTSRITTRELAGWLAGGISWLASWLAGGLAGLLRPRKAQRGPERHREAERG